MPLADFRTAIARTLPADRVTDDAQALRAVADDMTECPAGQPALVVRPQTVAEVQAVVRAARAARVPLVPRLAGTNLGGLTIPAPGAVVVDLLPMNRIIEVNEADQYAVLEPGVTWEQLKAHLEERKIDLVMGYPLSPPDTSIMANCLLDGLGNLSLVHGSMADWITGLEVVLPDGSLARTGAAAAGVTWCSRGPFPDVTGLFVSFQGTTGICTKLGVTLWPKPAHRTRLFVLCYDRKAAIAAQRSLARTRIADDLGGLSWPTGKMLLGVPKPGPRDPDEPDFFLYVDISGMTERDSRSRWSCSRRRSRACGSRGSTSRTRSRSRSSWPSSRASPSSPTSRRAWISSSTTRGAASHGSAPMARSRGRRRAPTPAWRCSRSAATRPSSCRGR